VRRSFALSSVFAALVGFGCSEKKEPPTDGAGGGGDDTCAQAELRLASAESETISYGVERQGSFAHPRRWSFAAEAGDVVEAILTPNNLAARGQLDLFPPQPAAPPAASSTPVEAVARGVEEIASERTVVVVRFAIPAAGVYTLLPRRCIGSDENSFYRLKLSCAGGGCTTRTCPQLCNEGEKRCTGSNTERCEVLASGCIGWVFEQDCTAAGAVCLNNHCEPCLQCDPNLRQCSGRSIQACREIAPGCRSWVGVEDCDPGLECKTGVCVPAGVNNCEYPNVMIMLDQSGSMGNQITVVGGQVSSLVATKMDVAKEAITAVVRARETKLSFGFMSFPRGTRTGASADYCSPGYIFVDPGLNHGEEIIAALSSVDPNGATPISGALQFTGGQSTLHYTPWRSFLLLITDGEETCTTEDLRRVAPIARASELADAGISTFVVGFGRDVDPSVLNKVAAAGGTARAGCNPNSSNSQAADNCYYQAEDTAGLTAAIDAITGSITQEICDGLDNNCNGEVDENLFRPCATTCGTGREKCIWGKWFSCDAPRPNDAGACPAVIDAGSAEDAGATVDAGVATEIDAGDTPDAG
jgi:hypothetical protein